jgi:hypothetical protein
MLPLILARLTDSSQISTESQRSTKYPKRDSGLRRSGAYQKVANGLLFEILQVS